MKRILLSVFAAAMTAAWALPVSAADVTFSGQYRLRGEYRNNADFNNNANDHADFWGQRVRLTANAKATDDTSVKITLQDTRTWGTISTAPDSGPSLTDTGNTLDLHESYVNVENLFGAPVSLRAGRQELAYGDERLIGSFGWNNNGRSFDALKFVYTSDPVNVDVFTSKIKEFASNVTAKDQDLYGIYATVKSIPNNTLDLYALLWRDNNGSTPFITNNTTSGTIGTDLTKSQRLYTYGARLKGTFQDLDYTAEVPFQTGAIDTRTAKYKINASAFAVKAGYTIPNTPKVRVGVEYDYASGDKDATATDTKIKTFSNLFPTNHDKLGFMDQQAWRNVKAINLNVGAQATEQLKLYASYWNFKLAQKQDAWYGAATWNSTQGTALRSASATESNSSVGNEVDLVATYKYNSALTADLGYSRFMAGKFIKDRIAATAGADKGDQDWAYLSLTANF